MKVIMELENEQEMKQYERFLKAVNPALVMVRKKRKIIKTAEFLNSIEKIAVPVDVVLIPDRESRNAR